MSTLAPRLRAIADDADALLAQLELLNRSQAMRDAGDGSRKHATIAAGAMISAVGHLRSAAFATGGSVTAPARVLHMGYDPCRSTGDIASTPSDTACDAGGGGCE